jgi:heterodisulfide reductase subunit C
LREVNVNTIESKNLDPKFKTDVATHAGGENLRLCFACGTCTAGCPVSEVDPDFNPRKIIREVLLGLRKEVLSSPLIWRCVQCYSCTAKCPQNVRFREIIRALREMAVAEGHVDAAIAGQVTELGKLSQKLRRDMVAALVEKRVTFDQLKQKMEASIP